MKKLDSLNRGVKRLGKRAQVYFVLLVKERERVEDKRIEMSG
jgi:hypothetical protein